MKKYAEKAVKVMKIAAAAGAFLFCLTDTGAAAEAVGESIERCINVVIPSLFAMMAASSLIIRSGMTGLIPKWAGNISRYIFGMDGGVFPIFTFGMFAGYPIGVRMLCEEYSAGRLPKRRAELLSGLCFGAGPAFIFGCISRQLYSSQRAGMLILISTMTANVLLALIMSAPLRKTSVQRQGKRNIGISAEMLTDCVLHSGRAMADICIMIAAFSVMTELLRRIGAIAAIGELLGRLPCLDSSSGEALAAAFLDVTNIGGLPCGDWLLLPYISGLAAFGGVCVFFQIAALSAGRISLKPLILMRSAAAVISFFVCRFLMPYFIESETTAVSAAKVSGVSAASPVPSVMLILMTAMLMYEFGDKSTLKHIKIHQKHY